MKRKAWCVLILCCVFAVGVLPAVSAARSLKIGYFDLQLILDKSKWGKQVRQEFKAKQKALKAEVERKAKAFKRSKEAFEKKKSLLDSKAKRQKLAELRRAQIEGEQLIYKTNAKLNKLSQQLTAPIIDKILQIVKKIGKSKGYDFIFEVQKSGMAYAKPKDDLTRTIIKELDKVAPHK